MRPIALRRAPTSAAPASSHRLPASLAALGVACTLLATIASATASATPGCAPADGLRAAAVATADRADGTRETTEFFPDGAYRVTRCTKSGGPLVSQTVSPILDPDGGVTLVPTERQEPGVTVSALYGDPTEDSWAREFRASRAALRAATIAPTVAPTVAPVAIAPHPPDPADTHAGADDHRAGAAGLAAKAAVANDACTNSQYSLWVGAWVNRAYGYRVNRSRFNWNDTSVASIVKGHRNWDTTFNSCGLNDITNLNSVHLGSTSATIHTYPDGQSITDRGNLTTVGCPGALACTWLYTNAAGSLSETDQRFNENITFSNVGAAGAYDYQSVATHETGHSIGLNHASSSSALTMFPAIGAGTTHARTLAKGDVLGMRARYP